MNPETGQVRLESQLTEEQKKKFMPLPDDHFMEIMLMNRKERRAWVKKNRHKLGLDEA